MRILDNEFLPTQLFVFSENRVFILYDFRTKVNNYGFHLNKIIKKATAIENRELSTLASKLYIRSEKSKPTEKKKVEGKKKKKGHPLGAFNLQTELLLNNSLFISIHTASLLSLLILLCFPFVRRTYQSHGRAKDRRLFSSESAH